jgi:hypothetical protein
MTNATSALGQKRTLHSALPPIADIAEHSLDVRFVPIADIHGLLDDLIGAGEKRWRQSEAERLGCCEVDDHIEFGRLLDRDVGRLFTSQDFVNEVGRAPELRHQVWPIGHETARPRPAYLFIPAISASGRPPLQWLAAMGQYHGNQCCGCCRRHRTDLVHRRLASCACAATYYFARRFSGSVAVVQHQFERTFWAHEDGWSFQEAALHGSSHYDLPGILRWFTANIGVHHVHHLCSRIPCYRLPRVLREHPELRFVSRLALLQSFQCVRLALWDESRRRLVSFREINVGVYDCEIGASV